MEIRFIGAYPVEIPPEAREIALAFHNDVAMAERELSDVALVELEIFDPESEFDLLHLHQDGSDWAPWSESYYAADSLAPLPFLINPPQLLQYRVAFYIHFYVPGRKLNTPWGTIECGSLRPIPRHLLDKQYMYWR